MYPEWVGFVVVLISIWITVLTFYIYKVRKDLNKILSGRRGDVKVSELEEKISNFEQFKNHSLKFIQKIVLKRYNPYHDTGGNQSFSIALLNKHGDGIVLTSLHARAGTRVFAKSVSNGKEKEVKFSDEEQEAVEQALNN